MSESPRILILGENAQQVGSFADQLRGAYDPIVSNSLETGLEALRDEQFAGICLVGTDTNPRTSAALLLQHGGILQQLPDGLVLLDADLNIVWCNPKFEQLANSDQPAIGRGFYDVFGTPDILGPDFCPFHTALGSGTASRSTLRIGERSYFQVQATPVLRDDEIIPDMVVVLVRDISAETLQQQKLNAIYQAGLELGDLAPQEILEMSVSDRIELLKSKIIHYTQDLLEFETVEIRLVDQATKLLEPLLVSGMEKLAADRELYAKPQGNGVTGFVAATGKSYLCEDTDNDPLYLSGAPGARSSLTVPLIMHEQILGTFNVESTRPGAFSENDLQFLELFSREVAVALNTLELLVAEKITTASESINTILREISNPVDEVLNDAARVLERYIGHEPSVSERLQRILKHTREIKQLIQKVGETIAPKVSKPPLPAQPERPKLRGKRVLVADDDQTVRMAARELLGRFGCDVETAHNGDEALLMARSFQYDAVLADIRLPDMTGYECFCLLKELEGDLPVILMTGFGYDPGHSIVKARQAGLKAVLYKPFRLDQLLEEVESACCNSTENPIHAD